MLKTTCVLLSLIWAMSLVPMPVLHGADPGLLGEDGKQQKKQGKAKLGKKESKKKESTRKEKYAVVLVGEELRAVPASRLQSLRKELAEKHKQAMAEYGRAKKQAARDKQKFEEPRPVPTKIKVLAQGLASLEAAEEKLEREKVKRANYIVVLAGGELKALSKSELPALRKELDEQYKESLKEYESAKKESAQAGQRFTQPRPTKPQVKVVAEKLVTQDAAEKKLEGLREKFEPKEDKPKKKKG